MALFQYLRTTPKIILSSPFSKLPERSVHKNYVVNHLPYSLCVLVEFILPDGRCCKVIADKGDSIWKIAVERGIMKRNPQCDGVLKCHDCHATFKKVDYDKLPEMRSDEKLHLEHTTDSTPTSRSCCQIRLFKYLDGLEITLPP